MYDLIARLQRVVGPNGVVAAADALRTYDADASMLVARTPELVVLPTDSAQAAAVVRLAAEAGLPVVARGAGTGIAGGAVPVRGGVVLSTARMDRVEAIEPRSRRAVVQPGVVNAELNARLAPLGLQFAPDPSSQRASTIGGNLATNAGGPHCLKYGVTSNHILAVELVRADGALVWTAEGVPDEAGYDLTGLVVGSEGTFGLVTRAMLRLTPLPEANRVVLALFPSVVAASSAVSRIIAAGSLPTSLEVMDHNAIRAVNGAYGLGLPEAVGTTLLIVELDGVEEGLDEALAEILDLCRAEGAFELRPARTPAEQARVWAARKSVAGAIGRLAPAYLLVDTVVPRTRLPLMMEHVERLRQQHGMEVCNVFHAGDGNLHPLVLYNPQDAEQARRAHAIAEGVLELSIQQGGVISGEHGIGLEKQQFLPMLFSRTELQLQAVVHQVFNPGERFNPAKIFPLDAPPALLAEERRTRMRRAGEQASEHEGSSFAALVAALGVEHGSASNGYVSVAPGDLLELSRVVAHCYQRGMGVQLVGSSSASPAFAHLLAQPSPPLWPARSLPVSLARLNRTLTYEPDDLTIGVEAGTTLGALQAALAANGQFLPLDGPSDAPIGALVAAAADSPRRLGYGTMRDWVLALSVVEADGAVSRLGAQVVKNVTGYDLVKLFVGSRDSLGLIAAVSLRVFPLPPSSATCVACFPNRAAAFACLDALVASRLQPSAVELLEGLSLPQPLAERAAGCPLLALRCEGRPAAVARHLRELAAIAARHGVVERWTLENDEELALWSVVAAHNAAVVESGQALVRIATPPAELSPALDHAAAQALALGLERVVSARALSGVALLRLQGEAAALRQWLLGMVQQLRHVHLLAGLDDLRHALPAWGVAPPGLELMLALKAALDPDNSFGPPPFTA